MCSLMVFIINSDQRNLYQMIGRVRQATAANNQQSPSNKYEQETFYNNDTFL